MNHDGLAGVADVVALDLQVEVFAQRERDGVFEGKGRLGTDGGWRRLRGCGRRGLAVYTGAGKAEGEQGTDGGARHSE